MTSRHSSRGMRLRSLLERSASRLLFGIGATCAGAGLLLIVLVQAPTLEALGSPLIAAGAACLLAGAGFVVAAARDRDKAEEANEIRVREASLALAARLYGRTDHRRQHFAYSRLNQPVDLAERDFRYAILDYVEWPNATVRECTFDGASLIGATLGCDGAKARFVGAILERARLVGLFDEAVFSGARCSRVDFRGASLFHSSFIRSDGGGLTYLREANFAGSDALDGTNFSGALAEGANFTRTTMYGTIFEDAFLCDAQFDYANLCGCNLRGAMLSNLQTGQRISLKRADLGSEDDFMASDLSETWLLGVDLSTTMGLEHANLTGALANAGTTFPAGIIPEDHGVLMLHLMSSEDRIAAGRGWIECHGHPAGWL